MLRGVVNPFSLQTVEWLLFTIVRNDVLSELWPDLDNQISKMSDDRKVVPNGVLSLGDIKNRQQQKKTPPPKNPDPQSSLEPHCWERQPGYDANYWVI